MLMRNPIGDRLDRSTQFGVPRSVFGWREGAIEVLQMWAWAWVEEEISGRGDRVVVSIAVKVAF
ncbi:MAG: hypothetical protein HC860_27575 [Alkalinema sp. RU_4_3]|nr:hypothetical protein [Alkalinema sp. RU_4_3]